MTDIWDRISDPSRVYIIAEAGVNHNGSIEMALNLIEEAAKSGADCVKFQSFKAERVASAIAPKANYQLITSDPHESQIDMLKKLELPEKSYEILNQRSDELGIDLFSTPYNFADVDLLLDHGFPAFKIASGQIVELPFIKYVASKMRPIILSTGMATMQEIKEAVNVLRNFGNNKFVLLQCNTNYPSKIEDANLRVIPVLKRKFSNPVGYSDHTLGNLCCIAATAIGAVVIEKHFTLDKSLPGPDQSTSADPLEMRMLIDEIREVETTLGSKKKIPTKSERSNTPAMRRSISARVDIQAGTIIEESMLDFIRPSTGLPPKFWNKVVGSKATSDIKKGTLIGETDFEQ